MKYLFNNIYDVDRLLHANKRIILLSDYDGTLTPIREHPDLAVLSETIRELLLKFSFHQMFRLGIVTGRSLKQIKNLVNIPEMLYVANYGVELEGPNIYHISPEAQNARHVLRNIYFQLLKTLKHIEGVYIEDKDLSISLHYRLVKTVNNLKYVHKIFHTITEPFLEKEMIHISTGKMVYEIRSHVNWNKARRIAWLLDHYFPPEFNKDTLIVYLGDDTADEEVFTFLSGKGLTVFVGKPSDASAADYFLHSSGEVTTFLKHLHEQKAQSF